MTMTENRQNTVIGTRQLRREDPALLTGEAKFTNDLNLPGALHLSILRSPHAHAKIVSIDTAAAKPSGSATAPVAEAPKAEAPKVEEKKAEAPAPAATYAAQAPSPAARKILDEKNIQPSDIVGTGKDGRITKEDAVNV